jgi:putative DNA primase/helicase
VRTRCTRSTDACVAPTATASVKRVCIYADNDADAEFAGQASAYALAQRLQRESKRDGIDRKVQVFVPKQAGADWADIWLARVANEAKAGDLPGGAVQ